MPQERPSTAEKEKKWPLKVEVLKTLVWYSGKRPSTSPHPLSIGRFMKILMKAFYLWKCDLGFKWEDLQKVMKIPSEGRMAAKSCHLIGLQKWGRWEKNWQERIVLMVKEALVLDFPLVLKDKTMIKSSRRNCPNAPRVPSLSLNIG